MIEIKNISKTFEGQKLYEDFSLKIENGEFVVITGESGCGKTTLLNMIGAIEKTDSGTILIDGKNVMDRKNRLEYFRKGVGFLFQNYALIDNKTVKENLKIVKGKCKNNVSIEKALKRVGLEEKVNTKVYKLSGGEQQRAAIARLMIKECSVVLADEPTGSLDWQNGKIVINLLKQLQEEGKTIIMVTHDLRLRQFGSRVVELKSLAQKEQEVTVQ